MLRLQLPARPFSFRCQGKHIEVTETEQAITMQNLHDFTVTDTEKTPMIIFSWPTVGWGNRGLLGGSGGVVNSLAF